MNALLGVGDVAGEDVPSQTVDEVLDEAIAGHIGAGSVGNLVERLDIVATGGAGGLTDTRAVLLDNLDALISSRLAPTVAARTLDIAATGEAGLDFNNTLGTHPTVGITAAAVDLIWDELMAGHVTVDSAAVHLKDILADVTGIAGAAMRGTDGVDTATMRGTDSVDTGTHVALVNLLWNELTSEGRTAGSYGQLFKDNVDAAISAIDTTAMRGTDGVDTGTHAALVNLLWNELTSEGRTAGSYGQLFKDNIDAVLSTLAPAILRPRSLSTTSAEPPTSTASASQALVIRSIASPAFDGAYRA